jgi:alkylation response protein AidB-like acyl-CoA dehydrogenase
VAVFEDEILSSPGPLGSPFATLRPLIAQLSLINVYVGIAEGAFVAACALARGRGKGWFASGVERLVDDPYVTASVGDSYCDLEGARALADAAAVRLDRAWALEGRIAPSDRGELAIAVAVAKVAATRAALEVTNRIFDATGARATAAGLGLDRFWRNARTHTLHDPVDYKRRDIGRWLLTDEWPAPSFYS